MHASKSPWAQFQERIGLAKDLKALEAIEHDLFGRKGGALTAAMKGLKDLKPDARKERASELNEWKGTLESAIETKRQELLTPSDEKLAKDDRFDVTLDLPTRERGHLHLVPEFIAKVEEVFGRMGFDTAYGPEIEEEELNFDLLNIPETHPARDAQDTFWIRSQRSSASAKAPAGRKVKGPRFVLRTHTSPVQIRYMRTHKPPFRAIFPGKCYRKDADATHSPMFHQFEGLMVGKDISLAHMKAVMITAMKELISPNVTFRFRTGYFPFVEPGLEMDMQWEGDIKKSREGKPAPAELRRSTAGWLEMAGCGMVHPQVLRNGNIDPEHWQGFAFGFGVERPLMIKHQIPDLRAFFEGDLRFLRQF